MRGQIAILALALSGCQEVVELYPDGGLSLSTIDAAVLDTGSTDAVFIFPDAELPDFGQPDATVQDALPLDAAEIPDAGRPDSGLACVCRLLVCRLSTDCTRAVNAASTCDPNFQCTGAKPGSCQLDVDCGGGNWHCTTGPASTDPCP
ncbi:MAG: hypothetical protein U1E65_09720 [Myxococcota bacterium]